MGLEHDHEMRCGDCHARMFSSLGPQLVAQRLRCPRCGGPVELLHDDPSRDRGAPADHGAPTPRDR